MFFAIIFIILMHAAIMHAFMYKITGTFMQFDQTSRSKYEKSIAIFDDMESYK